MEITIPDENTILHHLDTRETSHHYTTLEYMFCSLSERWMDGWMDGWIDGWMDGWMDGWIDGWMDG